MIRLGRPPLSALAAAIAVAGAAIVAPAVAHAGTDDDTAYLGFLRDHGVPTDTPVALKQTALGICRGFDQGLTFVQVGGPLMDDGATAHQAAVEIFGAVGAYCPRNDQALSFADPAIQLVHSTAPAPAAPPGKSTEARVSTDRPTGWAVV